MTYYAWYELYPAYSVTISSITVHGGDKITASVTYSTSTGKFTMTIADGSHSFTKVGPASGARRSSAECIVERDSLGGILNHLSRFKTDTFSSCTATINGATGGIGSFPQVFQITMKNGAYTGVLATTSALTSSISFHCTWKGYTQTDGADSGFGPVVQRGPRCSNRVQPHEWGRAAGRAVAELLSDKLDNLDRA